MSSPQRRENRQDSYKRVADIGTQENVQRGALPKEPSAVKARIEEIDTLPRRNPVLHWFAFILSLVSLIPPIYWLLDRQLALGGGWLWPDTALAVFFAFEFFTRSGFRWNPVGYVVSHFFDFVALVPAIVLVHYAVPFLGVWVWIILIARVARVVNRLLGDGFVARNILALLSGLEEEITDRVLIRIMDRIHDDMDRGKVGHTLSEAIDRNKEPVLRRIQAAHPQSGLGAELARLTGLEAALERAEARTLDAIVDVLASPEIDHAIHEAVDSTFSVMREEIRKKAWRKNFGIKPQSE
jgi:hypothetical protein